MNRKKVLIADDTTRISALVVKILKADYDCDTAQDGAEALVKLGQKKYDLLITDIDMPNVNGIELVQAIQKNDQAPKIIMMSGTYQQPPDNIIVDSFIAKPFQRQTLIEAVNATLKHTG